MSWIRGKLADHVEDPIVLSPERVVLVTSPETESSYPPPPIVETLGTWMEVRKGDRLLRHNTYLVSQDSRILERRGAGARRCTLSLLHGEIVGQG